MECTICFESILEPKQLTCGHSFHSECIDIWLEIKGSCPNCRFQEFIVDTEVNLFPVHADLTPFWIYEQRIPSESTPRPISPNFQTLCLIADSQVSNRTQTDTHYSCEIAGVSFLASKEDIDLVHSQTDESIERCLFFLHRNNGDIVNTILDMC